MKHQIFISYSHHDAALVTPVVRLLRATKDLVFLDVDTIQPGRKWRTEIETALSDASLIVVFWCGHSRESSEVRAEYQAAVGAEKDVLPVLLDSTPMPHDLEAFQWIDFREFAQERHSLVTRAPMWKRLGWLTPWAGAFILVFLLCFLWFLTYTFSIQSASPTVLTSPPVQIPNPSATETSNPTPLPSPTESPDYPVTGSNNPDYTLIVILFVIIGIIVVGLGALIWHGRGGKGRLIAQVPVDPTVQEQQMSMNLEEEIRRRLSAEPE